MLDPDVVLRADGGVQRADLTRVTRGAEEVASGAITYAAGLSRFARPVLVNGVPGVYVAPRGRPFSVMAFIVRNGKIVEIDALTDPERLAPLDVTFLDE